MSVKRPHDINHDEALLARIQKRDESALSDLYDEKVGLVYSLAFRIVGNRSDAEEVTVDVFHKVWQRAEAFDPTRGSVLAWLTTMARRQAIDKTRSHQFRARGTEAALYDGTGADHTSASAGVDIDKSVQAGEILDALVRLGPNYRDVISLSYYEGMSHAMIAERLELPLGTVKSRLREGVTQLRRLLDIDTA